MDGCHMRGSPQRHRPVWDGDESGGGGTRRSALVVERQPLILEVVRDMAAVYDIGESDFSPDLLTRGQEEGTV